MVLHAFIFETCLNGFDLATGPGVQDLLWQCLCQEGPTLNAQHLSLNMGFIFGVELAAKYAEGQKHGFLAQCQDASLGQMFVLLD